jgi:GNAT superfamily N-acetyltransferase
MKIELLEAADHDLVERLADLVNRVYAEAEDGLWQDGATRTTASELHGWIDAREIAVATIDGRLAGAVRIQALSDDTGEFGMLAAAPEDRGIGVGRALVAFAEGQNREHGRRAMQLELLVPRTWRHPSKVFLDGWYRRIGYRVIRRTSVEELQPDLAPLLATPCEFAVYEKALDA